jgi:hypothetical protein
MPLICFAWYFVNMGISYTLFYCVTRKNRCLCCPSRLIGQWTNRQGQQEVGGGGAYDWQPHLRVVLTLVIFSYNSVLKTIISFFDCIPVYDDRLLASAPAISCTHNAQYNNLKPLVYVLIVFVGIGVPVGFLSILLYGAYQGLLINAQFRARFGVLYVSLTFFAPLLLVLHQLRLFTLSVLLFSANRYEVYSERFFFWDVVVLVRRVIVISVLTVGSSVRQLKLDYVSVFNILALVVHMVCPPLAFSFRTVSVPFLLRYSFPLVILVRLVIRTRRKQTTDKKHWFWPPCLSSLYCSPLPLFLCQQHIRLFWAFS